MSPFLFLLVMEGLKNMIKTANKKDWLRGFEVARAGFHQKKKKKLLELEGIA